MEYVFMTPRFHAVENSSLIILIEHILLDYALLDQEG